MWREYQRGRNIAKHISDVLSDTMCKERSAEFQGLGSVPEGERALRVRRTVRHVRKSPRGCFVDDGLRAIGRHGAPPSESLFADRERIMLLGF